ncbi:MAG: transcriptional regulator [Ktedonobacterales bacterium]|nr:transcriptional regulator [Ktedonobacterales bacterium]
MDEADEPTATSEETDEQNTLALHLADVEIDRLVHEPARLLILAVLNVAAEVDFKFLEAATKLSKGNLSRQTSKLEEGGYIAIHKYFKGKIPATQYRITAAGRAAFVHYWQQMNALQHPTERPPSQL